MQFEFDCDCGNRVIHDVNNEVSVNSMIECPDCETAYAVTVTLLG
jgi:hypothetical protein